MCRFSSHCAFKPHEAMSGFMKNKFVEKMKIKITKRKKIVITPTAMARKGNRQRGREALVTRGFAYGRRDVNSLAVSSNERHNYTKGSYNCYCKCNIM